MGNVFWKQFVRFKGLDVRFCAFIDLSTILIDLPNSQKPVMMSFWFFTLLNMCAKTIKNSRTSYNKDCQFTFVLQL